MSNLFPLAIGDEETSKLLDAASNCIQGVETLQTLPPEDETPEVGLGNVIVKEEEEEDDMYTLYVDEDEEIEDDDEEEEMDQQQQQFRAQR